MEYSPFDDITEKLAAVYGIEDIDRFLNPTGKELHDPSLFKNIHKARDRIVQAIDNGEDITIHADVDWDGASSTAIMYRYLRYFTRRVKYIHSQRSSGHGISTSYDDIPDNTDLLIIVDSSSSETEWCKRIKENNIDVIVIDHHQIEQPNPYCILVNPQQEGCEYPNKNVSGGLVCWKMCQVLDRYYNTYYANQFADLAGFSVVADAMNMMNYENRAMAKRAIENIENLGLTMLIKECKKDINNFTCTDFQFKISPCVTAVTRFDKLELAIKLFVSDDEKECKELSKKLIALNEERKRIQTESFERLKLQIGENPSDKCIVVVDSSIGKGFNGVVANDLATYYQRPVIIFGESENNPDEYRGSYRSYDGFNMMNYLETIPEALFAAGHAEAGGTGCLKVDLDKFKESLNIGLKDKEFERVQWYVLEFYPFEIDEKLIREIENFYRVCGNGFESGKFLVNGLGVESKEPMSKKNPSFDNFKVLCDSDIKLCKFKSNEDYFNSIPVGKKIDVVGSLNLNIWYHGGFKKYMKDLQVFIDDFRLAL